MEDAEKEIAYQTYKASVYQAAELQGDNLCLDPNFLREQKVWHRHSLLRVLLDTQREFRFPQGVGIVSGDVELSVSEEDARRPKIAIRRGRKEIYSGRNFRRAFDKLLDQVA